VLRSHRDRLLADHAATGVGVGVDDAQRPAIVVYLPPGRPLPPAGELEGVPLIFRTMAPLKPM
jgi:hypothetical protein